MKIGERIQRLRKEQGLSQEQFAKKLNIGRSTLVNYEQCKRDPSYETIELIAKELSVSPSYLIGRDCSKKVNTPYTNHWSPTDIKEVEELDLGNLNDLHKLVSMMDSGKWVVINLFYKNGSTKPPFMALGRIK